MTQRWRRKAQDVQAILRRKGEEVWWRVRGLVSKEGHAYYLPNEWRDVSVEQFEHEYEPVPSEPSEPYAVYDAAKAEWDRIAAKHEASLQLADKLAGAVKRMSTCTVGGVLIPMTSDVAAALSEYLESRGKGKGE